MMNDEIYYQRGDVAPHQYPYRALVAGARRADPADPPIATRFHEHCFILTRAGRGIIELQGRRHLALPGDIAWIDTSRAYAHHCHGEAERWHYAWISLHGYGLEALHTALSIAENPLFRAGDVNTADKTLSSVIERLKVATPASAAAISADIAVFLARLLDNRLASHETNLGSDSLSGLTASMRTAIGEAWPVPRMAQLAGLSSSQLHRRFQRQFSATPAEWLRRERINLARRYLTSGYERIATIAVICGYSDPFHFSRDFRKLTGMSPSQYRRSRNDGSPSPP